MHALAISSMDRAEVARYTKQVITFSAPRHIGHNPAGGAMIVLLLMNLILISLSGMVLYGAETQAGLLGELPKPSV